MPWLRACAMDVARMGPVDVERCASCKGTFLDGGEFRRLRKRRTPKRRSFPKTDTTDLIEPLVDSMLYGRLLRNIIEYGQFTPPKSET